MFIYTLYSFTSPWMIFISILWLVGVVVVGVLALQTNSVKWDTFGSSQMAGREARGEDELEAAKAPDEAVKSWKGTVGRHR